MEHLDELFASDVSELVHTFEEGGLARLVQAVVLSDLSEVSRVYLHAEQSFLLIGVYLSMLVLPLSKGWGLSGGDILLVVGIIDLQTSTTLGGLFF